MKVLGTIINNSWSLIGLMLKGKPSELGMSGNKDWMISHFSIDEAKSLIKKAKSCDFSIDNKGNIKSNSSKQLKDLPMYDMEGNPINNEIQIESLIERNGKIVGGFIIFPDLKDKKKIRIEDIQNKINELSSLEEDLNNEIKYQQQIVDDMYEKASFFEKEVSKKIEIIGKVMKKLPYLLQVL